MEKQPKVKIPFSTKEKWAIAYLVFCGVVMAAALVVSFGRAF